MEEINIKDLLGFFIKKIPLILVITIFVTALGVCYTIFLKEPLYNGDTTLIIVKDEDNLNNSSTLTQNDIALNQKLVATYSEIIKSRSVLNQVIDELNLKLTTSELSKKVSVSSVSNTEIIKISVSDPKAKSATRIANTIAEVFKEEIMDIYKLENVSIIDKAEIQDTPYNIQVKKDLIIFASIGLVLSCGIFFIVYYFDTSIKSSEEIENRLGITVIGSIPMGKRGAKK